MNHSVLNIQAYITGAELPISDYIVDTRLAVEQIPRLLAAMEHIVLGERETAGNFDLVCMFSAVRRAINSKIMVCSFLDTLALPFLTVSDAECAVVFILPPFYSREQILWNSFLIYPVMGCVS